MSRTIITIEEVRALPEETVLLERPDRNTMVCQKHDDTWYWTSDGASPGSDSDVELPALVIWTPEDAPDAP